MVVGGDGPGMAYARGAVIAGRSSATRRRSNAGSTGAAASTRRRVRDRNRYAGGEGAATLRQRCC